MSDDLKHIGVSGERFASKYFKRLEDVIAARSAAIKSIHRGDLGDSREKILVDVLNDHLPLISRAHQGGAILDCLDTITSQIDVVVYSNWMPLLRQSGKPIFLASGCHAAIEVKSRLDAKSLDGFIRASGAIKKLLKFQTNDLTLDGVFPSSNTAHSICTGIFAYNTSLTEDAIFKILKRFKDQENKYFPDFICVNGSFCLKRERVEDASAFYPGKDSQVRTLDERRRQILFGFDRTPFVTMLETILNYTSYIGPLERQLSTYTREWSKLRDNSQFNHSHVRNHM
jgi:hypothetical protein